MAKKETKPAAAKLVKCIDCLNASVKYFANGNPAIATCHVSGIKEVARAIRVCKQFNERKR